MPSKKPTSLLVTLLSFLLIFSTTSHAYNSEIENFKKILENQPNDDSSHFGLGIALNNLRRGEEAIREFKKAFKLNPTYLLVFPRYDISLSILENYQEPLSIIFKIEGEMMDISKKISSINRKLNEKEFLGKSLDEMKALIKDREESEKALTKYEREYQAKKNKNQSSILKLKKQMRDKYLLKLKMEIEKYNEIVNSKFGQEMASEAWKALGRQYPNLTSELKEGDVNGLFLRAESRLFSELIIPGLGKVTFAENSFETAIQNEFRKSLKELVEEDIGEFAETTAQWSKIGDQIAVDLRTGFFWMIRDFRQIEGRAPKNFQEVLSWVEKMNQNNFGGYTDWRLPNISELEQIYEPHGERIVFNKMKKVGLSNVFDEGGGYWYWSSDENNSDQVWAFSFYSGTASIVKKNNHYIFSSVRLIRYGKAK